MIEERKVEVITCDHCKSETISGLGSAMGAESAAKNFGWHVGIEDVCPKCLGAMVEVEEVGHYDVAETAIGTVDRIEWIDDNAHSRGMPFDALTQAALILAMDIDPCRFGDYHFGNIVVGPGSVWRGDEIIAERPGYLGYLIMTITKVVTA